jgi:hypothetical protein
MRILAGHTTMVLMLLTLAVMPELAHAQYADQLNRLFSTNDERLQLDDIRRMVLQEALQETLPGAESELPPGAEIMVLPPPPDDLYLMLEGTVRRADGSYTLWLNKEQVDQQQLPSNIHLARLGDLVVLWVNYRGTPYVVRPGQVLHFATETVYEPYLLPDAIAALTLPPSSLLPGDEVVGSEVVGSEVVGSEVVGSEGVGSEMVGDEREMISTISQTLNTIQEITQ